MCVDVHACVQTCAQMCEVWIADPHAKCYRLWPQGGDTT